MKCGGLCFVAQVSIHMHCELLGMHVTYFDSGVPFLATVHKHVWGVCVCVCVCVLPVSRDFCKEEKLFWPYMTGVQEVWGLFPSWLLTGFLTVGE